MRSRWEREFLVIGNDRRRSLSAQTFVQLVSFSHRTTTNQSLYTIASLETCHHGAASYIMHHAPNTHPLADLSLDLNDRSSSTKTIASGV